MIPKGRSFFVSYNGTENPSKNTPGILIETRETLFLGFIKRRTK